MLGSRLRRLVRILVAQLTVYTCTEARRWFARVLDEAREGGRIRIKRRDGSEFSVRPIPSTGSPLDVAGVDADVSIEDIMGAIREGRQRDSNLRSA